MNARDEHQLGAVWLSAIARHEVRSDVEAVYQHATDAITTRGPACWASGRCCNFEAAGHRLYVTGLEAAYTLHMLQIAPQDRQRSAEGIALNVLTPTLESAVSKPGCVFQDRNLCTVHAIKPLGCRVYFCDRSAQDWQHQLSERLISELRELHDRHNVPYRYGEWRAMLGRFAPSLA